MDVIPGGSSRAAPIDRNPVKRTITFNSTIGDVSQVTTTEATYTCPSGKKAYAEFMFASVRNTTTNAMNDQASTAVRYTPSGGSAVGMVQVLLTAGAAGEDRSSSVGGSVTLLVGDAVDLRSSSSNNGSGASVREQASVVFTEFDA